MTKRQKRPVERVRLLQLPNHIRGSVVWEWGNAYKISIIYVPDDQELPQVRYLDFGYSKTKESEAKWTPPRHGKKLYSNHDTSRVTNRGTIVCDPFNGSLTLGRHQKIQIPVLMGRPAGSFELRLFWRTYEDSHQVLYDQYDEYRFDWDERRSDGYQVVRGTVVTYTYDHVTGDLVGTSGSCWPWYPPGHPDFYNPTEHWLINGQYYNASTDTNPNLPLDWYYRYYTPSRLSLENAIESACLHGNQIHWSSLCREACAQARCVDINSLAYVRDLKHVFSLSKDMADIAGNMNDVKQIASSISSFFLSQHYGTRLTVHDTSSIAEALDSLDPGSYFQKLSSNTSIATTVAGYQGTYRRFFSAYIQSIDDDILHVTDSVNDAVDQLKNRILRVGYEADLLPSLANLWDLVPYSFVIDWFLPIGDRLEQIEQRNYIATLPVKVVYQSDKLSWMRDDRHEMGGCAITSSISFEYFTRTCLDRFPTIEMDTDNHPGSFTGHWFEATALILQKL